MVFMGRQFVYNVACVTHGVYREFHVISLAVFNIIFSIKVKSLVTTSVVSKEMSVVQHCVCQYLPATGPACRNDTLLPSGL
jgi:hypothetical protein